MDGSLTMRGAGAARAPSLRLRLLVLVGLVTVSLLALAGVSVWQAHDSARARTAGQMLGITRAMALLVDQEFARAETLLQALAADPGVAAGDPAAFIAATTRLGAVEVGSGAVLVLARAPNIQLATTLEGPLARPRPMPGGLEAVFASGATTISPLYPGGVTGRFFVGMAVPVPPQAGGAPDLAIGMTISRDRLRAALTSQHLPPGTAAAVLDQRGTVAARLQREEELVGQPATGPVLRGLAASPEGVIDRIVNQDGHVSVVAFARAPRSGYAVVTAVPDAAFAAERNQALGRLSLAAVPVVFAGLATALLLALRLRQALARLPSGSAAASGPRLREVEELARALATADAARAASEAQLRDRTAWLEQTQRAAHVGVWDLDIGSGALRWSDTMWRLYGLDPTEGGAMTVPRFRACILPEDRAVLDGARAEAERNGHYEVEFRIRRGDGALRWMRAQGVMERDAEGRPTRLLGANLDVTDARELAADRERLLAEKDLLVAEMHHRVKNSLQLVQGLLLLQARGAEPGLAARLREAAGRIVSIAAVHRRLYEGGPGPLQDAADHLGGLVEDLRRSVGSAARGLRLLAEPGAVRLPPERMAALGLLVTELVTNALKHGAGMVTVALRAEAGEAVVEVSDEGPGFPDGFDPARSSGLGMRVALAMARQLRGALEVRPGARVAARFPTDLPDGAGPAAPPPEEAAAAPA